MVLVCLGRPWFTGAMKNRGGNNGSEKENERERNRERQRAKKLLL